MQQSGQISAKEGQDRFVSQQGQRFFFIDTRDIIRIDNLQKGKKISGKYYAHL